MLPPPRRCLHPALRASRVAIMLSSLPGCWSSPVTSRIGATTSAHRSCLLTASCRSGKRGASGVHHALGVTNVMDRSQDCGRGMDTELCPHRAFPEWNNRANGAILPFTGRYVTKSEQNRPNGRSGTGPEHNLSRDQPQLSFNTGAGQSVFGNRNNASPARFPRQIMHKSVDPVMIVGHSYETPEFRGEVAKWRPVRAFVRFGRSWDSRCATSRLPVLALRKSTVTRSSPSLLAGSQTLKPRESCPASFVSIRWQ